MLVLETVGDAVKDAVELALIDKVAVAEPEIEAVLVALELPDRVKVGEEDAVKVMLLVTEPVGVKDAAGV